MRTSLVAAMLLAAVFSLPFAGAALVLVSKPSAAASYPGATASPDGVQAAATVK